MQEQRKTPGVYITELDAFPPSIVGIETAVPAFIGYTETAELNGKRYNLKPVRISSLAEYQAVFGGGPRVEFKFTPVTSPIDPFDIGLTSASAKDGKETVEQKRYTVDLNSAQFYLYNSLRLFYANGGGACYIVSVGGYRGGIKKDELLAGLTAIRDEIGPTMLVVPDAMLLDGTVFTTVTTAMITQCGMLKDRVAVLDVHGSDKLPLEKPFTELIANFRNDTGTENLSYGLAYFPSVQALLIDESDLTLRNFNADSVKLLAGAAAKIKDLDPKSPLLTTMAAIVVAATNEELAEKAEDAAAGAQNDLAVKIKALENAVATANEAASNAKDDEKKAKDDAVTAANKALTDARAPDSPLRKPASDAQTAAKTARDAVQFPPSTQLESVNNNLRSGLDGFKQCYALMASKMNILPASGAMAGVYAQVDSTRGVWNAPANISLSSVAGPTFKITGNGQDDLNVPIEGKAINAIRDFVGRGTLVWGARTLDGNSNDWRYIQVRRTLIYIEQSVQMALNRFVFAPNDGKTWVAVTAMISNFLQGLWSQGGLMGAKASEAFSVQCGLGTTMTGLDILNGYMRVQITLQMIHPAEFIELTFKQQMQGV